jgi:GH43 family beta-xylosidase
MGQDPWVVPYEGDSHLIQSSAHDRHILIHRFVDLDHIDDNEEHVIWTPADGDHTRELWAPELHHLAGRWYVYYAASDGENINHRMYVLEADHPLGPYREAGKVHDPKHDVWAIDMTVLDHDGHLYALWSGWETIDAGFPQHLYIAPMSDPVTIAGERHLISEPTYDWERSVAALNEGPQVLRNPDLLEWTGGDVCRPESWRKRPEPILTGGGHGCFVEAGGRHNAVYHRKTSSDPGWEDREIVVEPFTWDPDGYPVIA